MRRRIRRIAILLAVLLLPACAVLDPPEPPTVRLADLAIEEIGLFEQRYRLTLRVSNPNDRDLELERLRFRLALNGRDFADGSRTKAFRLPALDETLVDVTVRSNLGAVLDLIGPWLRGETGALDYRLAGEAELAGWPGTVPFERRGRLAAP